jgi:lantibiotic biosynthesis protein
VIATESIQANSGAAHDTARIGQLVETLEDRLMDAALAPAAPASLSTGAAGSLLIAARIMQLAPNPSRAARVRRLVNAVVEAVTTRPMRVGLWRGLVGSLYALEFVRWVDPRLLGEHATAVGPFLVDMDELLVDALSQPSRRNEFDLIDGHCGVGVYALVRSDAAAATRLYQAAEQALERASEEHPEGRAWAAVARAATPGTHDLGVAHGTPAVIGLLAHALRRGLGTGRTARLLDESISWLRAQEDPSLPHSRFASCSGLHGASSRLAWCYGDLGVAAMLAGAAAARHDPELDMYWRALAEHRIAQAADTWGLEDDALCHGRAGVLHLLRRLIAHDWDSPRARALAGELEQTLARNLAAPQPVGSHGLLNGWGGALLVLAESAYGARTVSMPWHLCLLTPV